MWAIGCIACEMSNGRPLFAGNSDMDQIHKILSLIGPLPENMEELKRNGKYNNFKFQVDFNFIILCFYLDAKVFFF